MRNTAVERASSSDRPLNGRTRPERDAIVVVVTYNSAAYISAMLASLAHAAPRTRLMIRVVDNGSGDNTAALARSSGAEVLESKFNGGYAAGINMGLRDASAADAVVLNPDLTMAPGSLDLLLDGLEAPGVGVTIPRVLDEGGGRTVFLHREPSLPGAFGDALLGSHFRRRPDWSSEHVLRPEAYEHCSPVDWASGAALAISAACRSSVGEWDESFFLYSEEVDYCRRVREAGYAVLYVPSAVVRHRAGGSGQSDQLRALMAINKLRYYGRWHPPVSTVAYRAALLTHGLLRIRDRGARAAVKALVNSRAWSQLPGPTTAEVAS